MKNTLLFLALFFLINFSNAQSSFTSYDIPDNSKANEQKEYYDDGELVGDFTQKCKITVHKAAIYFKRKMEGITDRGFTYVEFDFDGMPLSSTFYYTGMSISSSKLAVSENGDVPVVVIQKYDSEGILNAIDFLRFKNYEDLVFVIEPLVIQACHRQFEVRLIEDFFSNEKVFVNNKTTQYEVKDIKMKMMYIDETEATGEISEWKTHDENGNLIEPLPYLNSVEQEHSENVDKKESSVEKEYFENGAIERYYVEKTGEWKEYYESGELKISGRIVNGEQTGDWEFYYENGQLEISKKYDKGKKIGEWKGYYYSGEIFSIEKYVDGKPSGEWRRYLKNGKMESAEEYEDGVQIANWEFIYDYDTGQEKSSEKYENGILTWNMLYFYKNGNLDASVIFEHGVQTSTTFYYEDGTMMFRGNQIDGVLVGDSKSYSENGNLRSAGKYVDGKETGEWKFWRDDVEVVGRFVDGKETGEWRYYSIYSGKLIKIVEFENGKLIGN